MDGVARSGKMHVAVVGTGISGLSAAWLLSRRHRVTVYEADTRIGGHSNTVDASGPGGTVPVDTGFIVYNEATYPNLTALFHHLGVPTQASDMSFAVSLDHGRLEYAGTDLGGLFAQRRNIVRPRFLSMLRDLVRFYRQAPVDLPMLGHETTLGAYLDANGYGRAFQRDHLLPMAAAIWSAPADQLRDHPATAFIRFCDNHGLLKFRDRPIWRTVTGGSRTYVRAMAASFAGPIRSGCAATSIRRLPDRVVIHDSRGGTDSFDHVVLATHADQALALLEQPSNPEARLLGCFRSTPNLAVLHSDATLMPRRRKIWSSWNYIGEADRPERACVTYWMNRLQDLPGETPLFVTLNPDRQPRPDTVLHTEQYEHPQFDTAAVRAQRDLWSLQGRQRTWFCGAWFGAGFHEDGLQAGLAVAEQLGGIRRPWDVANENGRIHVGDPPSQVLETA